MGIVRVALEVRPQHGGHRLVGVADLIAQAGVIEQGILRDLGAVCHAGGVAEGIERLLLLVEFQVTLGQVVIRVLGYGVIAPDDLVELLHGIPEIALLVIGIAEQVVIGIAPAAPLALVIRQVGNGILVLPQVEITLPDDLVELGNLGAV